MALLAARVDLRSARRARRLAEEHVPLVHNIARRVGRELGWVVELDELVGPGHEGLVAAARRYDRRRGASFATYAGFRVRGAMLDAARALPPRMHNDAATLDALADHRPNAEQALAAHDAQRRVRRAIAALPALERHVVVRVYFEGAHLLQAGSEVGVSKSWASRIHARAIRRLRRTLAAAI